MHIRGARRRGLSLTEAIVAIFIIVYCVLTVFRLLHMGIDMDGRAERSLTAAIVCEKQLARVRQWASDITRFNSTSWAPITGTYPDSDFPQYSVTVSNTQWTVYSPCTQIEENWKSFGSPPQDLRRAMTSSFQKVVVNVSWDTNVPTSQVLIASLVGAPTQVGKVIQLTTPGSHMLSRDATVTFSGLSMVDAHGDTIPDVFFAWAQAPYGPQGSVGSFPDKNMNRMGKSMTFRNFYCTQNIGGTPTQVYGPQSGATVNVSVRARAAYDLEHGEILQMVGP